MKKNVKNEVKAERYVSVKTVSTYTSLPVKTLYDWADTGRIPSIKIGRRVLFDLNDIDRVMDTFKRSSNQCVTTANKIIGDIHGN